MLPLTVTLVSQTNQGLAAARNAGLRHSRGGEFIFLLDADDELAFDPVPWIREHRSASSLSFALRYVRNGAVRNIRKPVRLSPRNSLDVFTAGNALTVSSILFRKDRVAAPFDDAMFSLEDWLFWMMNPALFEDLRTFPETLSAVIHVHKENMTLNLKRMGTYRQKAAEKDRRD